MTALNLVEHTRVLLAHLYAKRDVISQTIASLEGLVGEHPDLLDRAPEAPPVHALPARRPVKPTRRVAPEASAPPAVVDAEPASGRAQPGAYDKRVLIALRDAGPLGLTCSDVTRAVISGPPEEVGKKVGTIDNVLKRLITAGEVVRTGRHYMLPPREED